MRTGEIVGGGRASWLGVTNGALGGGWLRGEVMVLESPNVQIDVKDTN